MKKLFALALVTVMTVPAFTQINFGLKAGVSSTSLTMPGIKNITSGNTTYSVNALSNARYGFHGGVFMRLALFGVYLQPELLLSTRSDEYTIVKDAGSANPVTLPNVTQKLTRLDIPVMLGYKLGPLRLNLGPSGSILLNSPKDLITDPNFKSMYNKMTIGYQLGVGVDILKKVTFDLRYEGSLKKYQNQIQNLTGGKFAIDDRPNAFLLSIGLIL